MSDNEIVERLANDYLSNHNACGLKQYFENIEPSWYQFIMNYTRILDSKYSFSHRLYWVVHNITNFPKCCLCNNPNMRIIKFPQGYTGTYKYCSHKCCVSSDECLIKRKETNIKHFGTATPAENAEIKERIKQTNLQHWGSTTFLTSETGKVKIGNILQERYGVDHISKSKLFKDTMSDIWSKRSKEEKEEIVSKIKHTLLERYGDENYNNREQAIRTTLELYGVPYAIQNDIFKEKSKQTSIQRYGVEFATKLDSTQEKIKKTNMERLGVEYPSQSQIVKDKSRNTSLIHYGVSHPTKSDVIKEKIKSTNILKYGSESVLSKDSLIKDQILQAQRDKHNGLLYTQTKEYKERMISFNQEKYHTDWSLQSDIVKEKSKQTLMRKYGCSNIFKSDIYKNKIRLHKLQRTYNRLLTNTSVKPLFSLNEFLENPFNANFQWQCLNCGEIFTSPRSSTLRCEDSLYARCYKCYPSNGSSAEERIIYDMIHDICPDAINNDRSLIHPKEIDIYIPSKHLAFEFDGLYWHSNQMLADNKSYHVDKSNKLLNIGIQLIHIFEDEWTFKRDIVKSRIKNLLGIYDNIVYARNCKVSLVNHKDSQDFLNHNHIQGYCNSQIRYGLYYNNELISLMTFGPFRRSLGRKPVENQYEMLRFCNKLGYHIPGAASRLFKHFIQDYDPEKIISYADRRWSKGNLYQSIGFRYVNTTNPNYWYVIGNQRQHRFAWRKSVLESKLEVFDSNKSEYENMLDNGIDCIYDCGNLLFEWIK